MGWDELCRGEWNRFEQVQERSSQGRKGQKMSGFESSWRGEDWEGMGSE